MYFIVYVTYKLLTWTKSVRLCKKGTEHPTHESQEPDRLLHPEEYEGEEHKPLLAVGEERNSDHCPQDTDTETYPACGNSHMEKFWVV